jgi:hypothetical protein
MVNELSGIEMRLSSEKMRNPAVPFQFRFASSAFTQDDEQKAMEINTL